MEDVPHFGLNSSIYYLGTGTSFDIKSKFPDDYQNFTVDNFIVGCTSAPVADTGSSSEKCDGGAKAFGWSLSKTYDKVTGKLNIYGNSQEVRFMHGGGHVNKTTTQYMNVSVWISMTIPQK